MHILILPSFYPSQIRPTTGIFFVDQINALRGIGHQVGVLIAPRLYETLDYMRQNHRLPPALTRHPEDSSTYRLHSIWIPRIFPLINAFIHKHAIKSAFQYYCHSQGTPDIIHAHNIFYGGYMAVQIAEQYNIPVVLTEHSTNHLRGRIFLPGQHLVARRTLQQVERPLAVGQKLADVLNQKYHPKTAVETIANVVDTDYFVPTSNKGVFTFVAVGQLTKRKRFDLLISAFAQLFHGQSVKLIIGGHGSEDRRLRDLIASLNMQSQVELAGQLSRSQVRELLQQASVVVSSSTIETFGVTLIEAMSCGKPIIATRSGGPEQFITDEVGMLIPVDDQQALADAMQAMFTSYDTFDQHRIREICIQQFSQQAIAQKLEHIYQQVLQSKN